MGPEERPGEAAAREPTCRLFFALWPDEAMRQAMAQATRKAVRASGGQPVPAANLHVTLAFLGSVPERRLSELADVARGAAVTQMSALAGPNPPGSALDMTFDRVEYWRAAHVLCASQAEPGPEAAVLARRLQDRLITNGFTPDWSVGSSKTRRFRPHVTLVRKVQRPPNLMEMQPVTWGFTDFVLVDSKTLPEGSVYTVLERFSFVR